MREEPPDDPGGFVPHAGLNICIGEKNGKDTEDSIPVTDIKRLKSGKYKHYKSFMKENGNEKKLELIYDPGEQTAKTSPTITNFDVTNIQNSLKVSLT